MTRHSISHKKCVTALTFGLVPEFYDVSPIIDTVCRSERRGGMEMDDRTDAVGRSE